MAASRIEMLGLCPICGRFAVKLGVYPHYGRCSICKVPVKTEFFCQDDSEIDTGSPKKRAPKRKPRKSEVAPFPESPDLSPVTNKVISAEMDKIAAEVMGFIQHDPSGWNSLVERYGARYVVRYVLGLLWGDPHLFDDGGQSDGV